jgi:hypothetical protein
VNRSARHCDYRHILMRTFVIMCFNVHKTVAAEAACTWLATTGQDCGTFPPDKTVQDATFDELAICIATYKMFAGYQANLLVEFFVRTARNQW